MVFSAMHMQYSSTNPDGARRYARFIQIFQGSPSMTRKHLEILDIDLAGRKHEQASQESATRMALVQLGGHDA